MTILLFWGFSCKEDSLARWRLLEPDAEMVSELAQEADVDLLCARVLANRGVSPGAAAEFLSPSLAAIGMPDEDQWNVAAQRVAKAIEDGERIGVFGDYDTDGITSAAVLFLALSHYTDNVTVRLPTRQTGYGLLEPYVRDLFAEGVDLLITADCGISNRSEVALANELGMEVVVTDHHIPPVDPPDTAVAVLDPKLWNPEDPLAGVGVAWKFAWAVARRLGDAEGRKRLGRLLDLVSVGTVVDIAPLVGDNRALAHMGLKHINRGLTAGGARPGIEALVKVAGVRGEIDEDDLGWRLGPRINSIGRIKNPRPALDLLLTEDRREAFRIASLLNQLNAKRQQRTRFAVERAMAEVDPEQDFKVVVTEETGGIAGLIAGRVAGATGRPAQGRRPLCEPWQPRRFCRRRQRGRQGPERREAGDFRARHRGRCRDTARECLQRPARLARDARPFRQRKLPPDLHYGELADHRLAQDLGGHEPPPPRRRGQGQDGRRA